MDIWIAGQMPAFFMIKAFSCDLKGVEIIRSNNYRMKTEEERGMFKAVRFYGQKSNHQNAWRTFRDTISVQNLLVKQYYSCTF